MGNSVSTPAFITLEGISRTNAMMLWAYTLLAWIYGEIPMSAVYYPEHIPDALPLTGVFAQNENLTQGVAKYPGSSGPESMVEYNGYVYTGLMDGRIVKIGPSAEGVIGAGNISDVITVVLPDAPKTIPFATKGRPLGMRIHGDMLFVVDSIYGVYCVNTTTTELQMLVGVDDANLKYPNDIEVNSDGTAVYFSDCSQRWAAYQILYLYFEGVCDGRVFKYDLATGKLEVLRDDLCMPNGVQLNRDESKLFVSETTLNRVSTLDLASRHIVNKLQLPTGADNIRRSRRGTYLIAGSSRDTSYGAFLKRQPYIRQWIVSSYSDEQLAGLFDPNFNAVYEMSEDGVIMRTWYDTKGVRLAGTSQALELSDGRIVLGSYFADYLTFIEYPRW